VASLRLKGLPDTDRGGKGDQPEKGEPNRNLHFKMALWVVIEAKTKVEWQKNGLNPFCNFRPHSMKRKTGKKGKGDGGTKERVGHPLFFL